MHPNTLLLLLDLNTAIKQGAKTNIQITEKNYSSIRRNNLSTERGILRLYTVNNCLSRTRPIPADTDTHLHNTCQSGHIQEEHTMNPNALCGKCTYLWKKTGESDPKTKPVLGHPTAIHPRRRRRAATASAGSAFFRYWSVAEHLFLKFAFRKSAYFSVATWALESCWEEAF